MAAYVLAGGTIFDGIGAARAIGDVVVTDGVIASVGEGARPSGASRRRTPTSSTSTPGGSRPASAPAFTPAFGTERLGKFLGGTHA